MVTPAKAQSKELSFTEKYNKIQLYLRKGVLEKILAQRGRIEGERKHITVLFCDMVEFTPIVKSMGHEDAFNIMVLVVVFRAIIAKQSMVFAIGADEASDSKKSLFGAR